MWQSSNRPISEFRAMSALTLAALFWSGNFIAGRALAGTLPPVQLNVIRWGIALLVLLPMTLPAMLRHRAALRGHWRLLLGLGLTGIAGFHAMVYQALSMTPAVNALLILSLAPVVTAMAGTLWNGYRPDRGQAVGLAVSVLGACVILLGADGVSQLGGLDLGSVWMLGAILVWAAYSLLLRHRPPELPQDVTLAASVCAGVVSMLPLLAVTGVTQVPMTGPVLLAILYIAIFASVLGFRLWSAGLSRIGPERAGQFLHLMPLFGALLAVALLGETFRPAHAVGAALAICGILLVNRPTHRRSLPRSMS